MRASRLTAMQRVFVDHIRKTLENEGHDVEELVSLLQITEVDIYERFKDRIWELRDVFTDPELMDAGGGEVAEEEFYGEDDDPAQAHL